MQKNRSSTLQFAYALLPPVIAATLTLGLPLGSSAQIFPAEIYLGDLDGGNGFAIDGEAADDLSGISVRAAGDTNGDGNDDLIVGARNASPDDIDRAGRSYVIFGQALYPALFSLGDLTTSPDPLPGQQPGFQLNGEAATDNSGLSVSVAGDINGDGIDDLIIGAPKADPNDTNEAGRAYVVFGTSSGFPSSLDLSTLNAINGFVINGEVSGDQSGFSVSAAGDVNDDGIDDLILGAMSASINGKSGVGRAYVVFGSDNGLPNPFNLSTIDGSNGFVLNGEEEGDRAGFAVSAAGDLNNDGIDDLLIGAPDASVNGAIEAGRAYVVFGSSTGFPASFDLSTLNALNGFVLYGEAAGDQSGIAVSDAGDINGDGIEDLIIGAIGASPNGKASAGRSYVVFGSGSGLPNPFDLSTLDGTNGFKLNGEASGDQSGIVSDGGDLNGDGVGDLVIGAFGAGPNGNAFAGRGYIVFGSDAGLPNPFDLSSLDGTNGFVVNGEASGDRSGYSVSSAGDINGDGTDDLVIGAPFADMNGNTAGRSYIVFGRGEGVFSDRFEDES